MPMLFHRPADQAVLEIRGPRIWFFLLGPFYLLWLRLWREAAVVAVLTWLAVRGAVLLVRRAVPGAAELDVTAALSAAREAVTAAPGPVADAAFQRMVLAMLPFYAAGLALLVLMVVLTAVFPAYLRRHYARRGWVPRTSGESSSAPVT